MNRIQNKTILHDAEELVGKQEYSGARELLQSIDSSLLENDDLVSYLLTITHASIYLGEFDTTHIDKALELLRSNGISKNLAKARLLKGLVLDKQGNYTDAQQHYLEASVVYRNLDDLEFASVAINLLGWTHSRMGDFEASSRVFNQALELMRSLRRKTDSERLQRKERDIAHNLSYLKIQFGRLRSALQDYQEYPISRNEIDSDSGRSYLLNQAKAYALCHEPDECRKNLDMCLPFLEKRKRDLAIYWQWLSRSYYVECVFTKAVECIEKAQKLVEESDSDLLPGILRWKAEYYWQLEQIDSAKECATLALKSANASKERVEIAASYLILGSVACFNREQKARELFQKSLDLLEEIDSQYELAMARRSAGCSGVYPIEESCQLLNQANEYFDREQIPRLSDSYTEDILFRIAVLQSSPSQQKRIAEILNSDQIR